jgi:hypothetical protein
LREKKAIQKPIPKKTLGVWGQSHQSNRPKSPLNKKIKKHQNKEIYFYNPFFKGSSPLGPHPFCGGRVRGFCEASNKQAY